MRKILANHEDFRTEKTVLVCQKRATHAYFSPSSTVNLKGFGVKRNDTAENTLTSLFRDYKTLPDALDSVSVTTIRIYFRKARDYERAYAERHQAGKGFETAVKLYKLHRRV